MRGWRAGATGALICALLSFSFVVVAPAPNARADSVEDKQLKQLRSRIGKIRKQMERDVRRRDETSDKLREVESRIQAQGKKLESIRTERVDSQTQLDALKVEQREREAALDADKSSLAAEVRAAFVNGRQEQLKLLLNQGDPAQLGRMTVYYRMFADHRASKIGEVIARLEALRETTTKVAAQTQRLAQLEAQRERELATLQATRTERKALLKEIAARLTASDAQVKKLEAEEKRLGDLLADLERVLKEYPVASRDAFPKLKGQMAWPLNGRLIADFGQPRAGQKLRWNGVLVGAKRGATVRAIARGRVAYADWLPGLGLLTILEHSDGYISLYGHNETLARQAGEWVNAGDLLSTVGDSGGQRQAALYFEIRRGRTPLNPHAWFKSPVGGR